MLVEVANQFYGCPPWELLEACGFKVPKTPLWQVWGAIGFTAKAQAMKGRQGDLDRAAAQAQGRSPKG